jgi:hypothetical protein
MITITIGETLGSITKWILVMALDGTYSKKNLRKVRRFTR